jgi:hypothetical protein
MLDKRIAGYLAKFQNYMLASTMEEAWDWVRKGKQALLCDPHPYKVVDRGGKWIAARGLYCGKLAYEAQLKDAEYQLAHVLPLHEEAHGQVEGAKQQLAQAEHQLQVQHQVRLLPEKRAKLEEERVACGQLDREAMLLSERLKMRTTIKKSCTCRIASCSANWDNSRVRLRRKAGRLNNCHKTKASWKSIGPRFVKMESAGSISCLNNSFLCWVT